MKLFSSSIHFLLLLTTNYRPYCLSVEQRRKYAAIEFDNKLLLERLAAVVQTKTIDNEVNEMTKLHTNFKKKLSLTKKKIEMQKITEENQRILKRIQEVPPAYNHFEWEEEAKVHDKHKRGMAIYPEYYEKLDREAALKKTNGRSPTTSERDDPRSAKTGTRSPGFSNSAPMSSPPGKSRY